MNKQLIFISIFLFSCFSGLAQSSILKDKLSAIPGIQVIQKTNINFKEYYEVMISQPLDHLQSSGTQFQQRIYIGFNNFNAPNVISTDGYAINYAQEPGYTEELSKELNANLFVIEHRFFGKSIPDKAEWQLLTVKQAADDDHFIKIIFDKLFKGKWISTGISKGGQAALAYKLYYPKDVVATVVYGTAVKNRQTITTDSILNELSQKECGKKLAELQLFSFKNKKSLLPLFEDFVIQKKLSFKPLDPETVFDYLLLEFPFSFWQNGNECLEILDTTASFGAIVNYIIKIVPPRFFSTINKKQLEPSFYMFYHELGYYEYDTAPFKNYLKQTNYPNSFFAPAISITFDTTYQRSLNLFLKTDDAETIFFIYGQYDPWALQTEAKKNIFTIKSGSHKSRIAQLPADQKKYVYDKINTLLK